MDYRGAFVVGLLALQALARAEPQIPDPPDAAKSKVTGWSDDQDFDRRVLDPCDTQTWNKAAVNCGELVGVLRHKGWSKSEESYSAGGSDYFVLYLDHDSSGRVFPRVLDDSLRKQLLKADGKLVRLSGRWAPTVRHTDADQAKIAEEWNSSQHPVDSDGKIPDPPTTWGGGFIADRIESVAETNWNQPDLRYDLGNSEVGWFDSATRPARASGVLRTETVEFKSDRVKYDIQRYWIETAPEQRIMLRYRFESKEKKELARLVNQEVAVEGKWARLLVRRADDPSLSYQGPVLKPHPTDLELVLAGGGIVVDRVTAMTTVPSKPTDSRSKP